ncbi:unnamed protein product [Caenorhabditis brenneri]
MSSERNKDSYNEVYFRPLESREGTSWHGKWKYGAAIAIFCVIATVNVLSLARSNHSLETTGKNTDDAVDLSQNLPLSKRDLTKHTPCGKRIVGYYTEFESIDITKNQVSKLTHAVFAYVEMTWEGKLRFRTDKAKQRFLSLKFKSKSVKTDVKVMIAIGGYENSQHFSPVTEDSEKRKQFINSIAEFLKEHQIQGVDFYWKNIEEKDKWNYITFIRELREKLNEESKGEKYLISLTIPPPGIANWEMGYDLEESLEDVDFFNVFSMDYYGPWENQWGNPAGPTSPLYSGPEGKTQFNVDSTMKYYICKSKQPNRFNIVIPFYARIWKNVDGPLETGNEVFRNVELKNNKAVGFPYMSRWTVADKGYNLTPATFDEETKTSYIYNSKKRTFLTFECEKSITAKTEYVNKMNLGGVWIWAVDMDDDKNSLLDAVASKGYCKSGAGNMIKYECGN